MLRKPMLVRPADHKPVTVARPEANTGHPLLELQRTAGNASKQETLATPGARFRLAKVVVVLHPATVRF